MKKLFILSLSILFFISCNTETKSLEAKSRSIDSVGFSIDSVKSTMVIYSDEGNAVYNLRSAQPSMAIGVTSSQVSTMITTANKPFKDSITALRGTITSDKTLLNANMRQIDLLNTALSKLAADTVLKSKKIADLTATTNVQSASITKLVADTVLKSTQIQNTNAFLDSMSLIPDPSYFKWNGKTMTLPILQSIQDRLKYLEGKL